LLNSKVLGAVCTFKMTTPLCILAAKKIFKDHWAVLPMLLGLFLANHLT
jgi:hypothetical protein